MADDGPAAKKACLVVEALEKLTKEELIAKCMELAAASGITSADGRSNSPISAAELAALRESEEKLRQQHAEATRRENILIKTLTSKEQELAECASQIEELKQYQLPSNAQLRTVLLDPTVNLMFQRMRKELDASKAKLEESQNELSAWKFTPDSQTGKRLMARCRMLIQENEELGKQISAGRIAKLEGDIALERALISEMKASQAETDEYLLELDGEMEGMQSTVYLLQQQLKDAKEQLTLLRTDNAQLMQRCSHAEAAAAAATAAAVVIVARDGEGSRSPDSRTKGQEVDGDVAANISLEGDQQPRSDSKQGTEGFGSTAIITTSDDSPTTNRAAVEIPERIASCGAPAEAMEAEGAEDKAASVSAAPPAPIVDVGDAGPSDDCSGSTAALPSSGILGKGSSQSDEDAARLSPSPRGSVERFCDDMDAQPAAQPPGAADSVVKPPPAEGTPRTRLRSARGSEASGTDDDASQLASSDTPTSPTDDDTLASSMGSTRTPARRSARTKRRRIDPVACASADGSEAASAAMLANGHALS